MVEQKPKLYCKVLYNNDIANRQGRRMAGMRIEFFFDERRRNDAYES